MGTTRTETGLSEQRNYTRLLTPVYCVLSLIVGAGLSGPVNEQRTIQSTLKLCNERPLECKFKYDILKYNETGQIPYKPVKDSK